jgi:CMP-N-acetylneuraminic acid synthetase
MSEVRDPLITVYVANHNYERFVEQAVESVLAQSMQDFELIIIDDGSTDRSRSVIERYENHLKVRIVLQDNKGLNRTANIALRLARGKYIMRLDADDYLDPQALLVMSSALEADPALGLVFPDYYYVDTEGVVLGQERRHDFSLDVSLLDQPAHGACTMIRKAFLIGIGGYSEEYRCQDGYDLWLRLTEKHAVKNFNLPLFYYRRHGTNLTTNNQLILETRAKIKGAHAKRSRKPDINVLGVLAVRGQRIDPGSLALENLDEKALIDWTIDAALAAEGLKFLVVSTPDERISQHVARRYGPRVLLHERPATLAREGVALHETIDHLLSVCPLDIAPDAIMLLSDETPFRTATHIDEAISTMRIFDVDAVIPIVPETDLFYYHNGAGLESIGHSEQHQGMRFERNYIYRKLPGMTLTNTDFFRREGKEVGGVVGHITYDMRSAFCVRTAMELDVADFMVSRERKLRK